MHRFGKKEMKKIMSIRNIWYDWSINYIPKLRVKGLNV